MATFRSLRKIRKPSLSRRDVLRRGFYGLGVCAVGRSLYGCGGDGPDRRVSNLASVGPLGEPDANDLRLPAGFTSRVVAREGEAPAGSGYLWHVAPDGGAIFDTEDGGWIYVSNSEAGLGTSGVGALRFDRDANVADAYSILSGTTRNCAGGPTPWGTWLSCEEFPAGRVWECDPFGVQAPIVRPALGVFQHEAVAVDPINDHLYLTEDEQNGRLYRFVPDDSDDSDDDGRLDLDNGRLEVARVLGDGPEGPVEWLGVPDPTAEDGVPTRLQVPESTPFRGGEGLWYGDGVMYFTTKGDNRVWVYEIEMERLSILYDDDTSENPILTGVDNVTVSAQGDVLVAEDGGDMQIVAFAPTGEIVPIVQVAGHDRSEVTGPVFDSSGTRLYFSSQRGAGNPPSGGVTYEVTGPFFV